MFKRPKVGLALGGGGARGLSHVGVLKILEKEHIPIDIITGTSAGSVVGAMYAQHPSIQQLEDKLRQFLNGKEYKQTGMEYVVKKPHNENLLAQLAENIKERIVINIAYSRKSIVGNKRLKIALNALIEQANIEDTKIKFGVATSDLVSGRGVLFTKGDIITAVLASSSIPGFLPPVEVEDRKLLDGVIVNPVPVQPAFDLGADVVIAVDVSPDLHIQNEFDNIIDITMRNSQMMGYAYSKILLEDADVVVRPKVGKYHWAEFNHIDKFIAEGEVATQKVISKIRLITKRRYPLLKKMNLR